METTEYSNLRKVKGAWNTSTADYERAEAALEYRVDRLKNTYLTLSAVGLLALLVHAVLLVGRDLHAMRVEAASRRANPR